VLAALAQGRGDVGMNFTGAEGVGGRNLGKAHQGVHQGQLPRIVELEARDAFAGRGQGRCRETLQVSAINKGFEDILLLVTGQVVPMNPAAAVRGPTHVVKSGETPVLEGAEWRTLLDSIPANTLRDMRDRALIATLTYSFARITAALKIKVKDLRPRGAGRTVRLHEKGGKEHVMPVTALSAIDPACLLAAPTFDGVDSRRGSNLRPGLPRDQIFLLHLSGNSLMSISRGLVNGLRVRNIVLASQDPPAEVQS
jgi:hypothetical protein